ncbi:GtrA family protein [Desulforhopalus sp. IMCC35007]|uniref:GtrA family protein n=1 Tax=Desulforhopalus sp. IMCC35007 TaxID=2569543 RepID=UPI00145FC79A|nr:GtrA family protein [Desulforhopalus sp. IMCC35007]
MKEKRNKLIARQLFRFVLVGISNTIISFLTFYVAYHFVLVAETFLSQCISYATGIVWSFCLNRSYTFADSRPAKNTFISFLLVQLSLMLFSSFLLEKTALLLTWNINLLWCIVMAIITAINFILTRLLVFNNTNQR